MGSASRIKASPPVVLVPACNRVLGEHPFHIAGAKYVAAVRLAGALPLVVPDAAPAELDALLDIADGVLLTGSPSNVHPSHFGEAVHDATLPLDRSRDAWTLPFIPRLIERRLPLLAICRGAQELNVALGGSLHQAVHALPGYADHRGRGETADAQYAPAHEVRVEPGGQLEAVVREKAFRVNSVHGQAVNRLASGLRVEARSPDGVIEAFSVDGMDFALGVQWHPEWRAADNPVSLKLLRAFGLACSDRAARRHNRREE
jgi:putative glutamine amidotransferase